MDVISEFSKLEGINENEEKMLRVLWENKVTRLNPLEMKPIETIEGDRLKMLVYKNGIVALLHKPTGLFLLIYGINSLELETLRYIVTKEKDQDHQFVSLVYEYLNVKEKGRLGKV
ncbi:hypothetical protein [Stygiolobus caldivivus]|uniref:Uncharacterized protein n=1 Tax=Stygiolobus caldivivus TaxID=2824673 RepID=A0A8D5ZJE8_9CREN|nr:hypothetical protein [Stygiolobus caldivivus]BCU70305.1 hypothetical protein KN1_16020 [Stygiolobus caldivivus]